jgi:hypothetical protein
MGHFRSGVQVALAHTLKDPIAPWNASMPDPMITPAIILNGLKPGGVDDGVIVCVVAPCDS